MIRELRLSTAASLTTLAFAAGVLTGCPARPADDNFCDRSNPDCAEGLVCDAILDGRAICAQPVSITGYVLNLADDAAIAGARVQAVDPNGAAVGTSAITAEDGSYTLQVPAVRNLDGTPVEGQYTLRSQAQTFQEFPTALRPALPIEVDIAVASSESWIIESPQTTMKLIGLPGDTSTLGSIAGTVRAEPSAGLLMVAENAARALTGFTDSQGEYVIFNVPAGSYTVAGYAAGGQFEPTAATVAAGEHIVGVDLTASSEPLGSVSGSVQIVNAPGGSLTSVVLAVESTFDEISNRGSVPPGLRAGDISGAFTIEGVPAGRYVVLAAFENDGLVRDPDLNIGGTDIVHIAVPDPVQGAALALPEGFKVTGALGVITPGADGPQDVDSSTPELTWEDDSSEDGYQIKVFDAFGTELWSGEVNSVSGSAQVSEIYAGPPLEPGMLYQFKVISFRERNGSRSAISATEDLKGVFIYMP
jgi:hypothetical protein